jgi:hypothetical protein
MERFKRNQIEEAIFQTLDAQGARVNELRFRLKRLLVADRRLGRDLSANEETGRHYAFYTDDPPGSGTEVAFCAYEAFALLAAVLLLEHGFPQAGVVRVMRQVRAPFETCHAESMKVDPKKLFDPEAISKLARPGMIATDNTNPVFLAFVRLRGRLAGDRNSHGDVAVCSGQDELAEFLKKHSVPGGGTTFFEYVGLMHILADNLSRAHPVKRGRGAV